MFESCKKACPPRNKKNPDKIASYKVQKKGPKFRKNNWCLGLHNIHSTSLVKKKKGQKKSFQTNLSFYNFLAYITQIYTYDKYT